MSSLKFLAHVSMLTKNLSEKNHLLKTPNFLTVTNMNMSYYHQVTVAVVSS